VSKIKKLKWLLYNNKL